MRLVICALLAALVSSLSAQDGPINSYPDVYFQRGSELYREGRFNAAAVQFKSYLDAISKASTNIEEASYFYSMSKLMAMHSDGVLMVQEFLENHPGSLRSDEANLAMGDFYYKKAKHSLALRYYRNVEVKSLDVTQRNQFNYRKGSCEVILKRYKEAMQTLESVANTPGEYRNQACYYHGYSALMMGDMDAAVKSFERIKDQGFDNVRFYLAQVYYKQGNYDYAIAELEKTNKKVPKNQVEWLRGKCYYQKTNYEKAAEAFRLANLTPDTLQLSEQYEIGYSFYKTGDFTGCLPWLKSVAATNDSIAQIASFQLGNAQFRLKNNREAMNAYAEAFRSGYNMEIAELALFNQAKIAISNGDGNAIALLDKFVKLFPKSTNAKEATKLKARMLINTDSYREAVALLDGLDELDPQTEEVYQKVTLARGMELYKNRNFNGAIDLFRKCQSKRIKPELSAEAIFWEAEAMMQLSMVADAEKKYQQFIDAPGAAKTEELPYAYYGLGYIQFNKKSYGDASIYFNKFTGQAANNGRYEERLVHDAYLRNGDCNFMTKQLNEAVKSYAYVSGKKGADADYALYQSGLIYGLLEKSEDKIAAMKRLIGEYPNSRFILDAYDECASVLMILGRNSEAITYYNGILSNFPNSPKATKAYSAMGRLYYNEKKYDQSIDMYTQLYDRFVGTTEAQVANDMVRRIYSEIGRASDYVKWAKPRGGITDNAQDSLYYEAAYSAYEKDDFKLASGAFDVYLQNYPKGVFFIPANYYKAQVCEELKQTSDAIKHYGVVALANSGDMKEDAALAVLRLSGKDASCDQILPYVEVLEGLTKSKDMRHNCWKSMMYCYVKGKQQDKLVAVAAKVMSDPTTPAEMRTESQLILVKSNIQSGKTDSSLAQLKTIYSKDNNRFAAEAKYLEAELLFRTDSLEACKNSCYAILDEFNGYDLWVGKALLLLGDAFKKEGDLLNAKATWNGVIENFEMPELVTEAKAKLKELDGSNVGGTIKETPPAPERK